MNVTCPGCGAEMDLDVLLAHEESRQALGTLALLTVPLAKRVLQYVRPFKPAKRSMSHGRTVKLIAELLPDLQRLKITHKGREWAAPHDSWALAIDRMLERRDNGRLVLPLTSHVYLYETLVGIADTAEAAVERDVEASRRHGEATVATDASGPQAVRVVAPTSEPSAYARKLRAKIEADRQRRWDDAQTDPASGEPS